MSINDSTLKKIISNAEIANAVWTRLALDNNFRECFHLRPTSSGISIVSTLPFAPMRRKKVEGEEELLKTLQVLKKEMKRLLSVKADASLLDGFKSRGERPQLLEEEVQAQFIRGVIEKQPQYEGIEFVGSEITLERKRRIDVMGFKDNTLYIFELKRGRTTSASDQVIDYVNFVVNNKESYMQVLQCYPSFNVPGFETVKGICVMEYAYNSSQQLAASAKKNNVNIWFFENSISLRK